MSLSKKIRFEVFKRDGFVCQYCGSHPPVVILEVDHIHPVSLGGDDSINNLVTACFDCNRGKRNIKLDSIPLSLNEQAILIKEREEQYKEYCKIIQKIERRVLEEIELVNNVFSKYYPSKELTEHFKRVSLRNFLKKLPGLEIVGAMELACLRFENNRRIKPNDVITYFCGICWNKIKENGKTIY